MAYATLIGACAAVAALACEPLARSRRIGTRWVWSAALLVSFAVPLAMAVRPAPRGGSLPATAAIGTVVASDAATTPIEEAVSLDALLAGAWLLASLLMLAFVGRGVSRLVRARQRAERRRIAGAAVAITRDTGPGAVFFGEPRIIVPRWIFSLGSDATEYLLRHEREHVRAGDPSLLAAALGALIVAPWNAPLWFVARRLRSAIEIDCDARVLAEGGDVRLYGELLLDVAARRRAPPFAAFLSFSESASPLERRIRAMTERRHPLTPGRRLASGALVLAAAVAACEARRPEPLAPVTTYSVEGGKATAQAKLSAARGDSVRGALQSELLAKVADTVLAGDANDPVLMVYASQGTLLYAARLTSPNDSSRGVPVARDAIESVDVIKGKALLPARARGGIVRVTLKPGAENLPGTWTNAGAATASPGEPLRLPRSSPPSRTAVDSALVVVLDASGKELLRAFGDDAISRVDPASIATVDVEKREAFLPADAKGKMIRIVLKPGAALER